MAKKSKGKQKEDKSATSANAPQPVAESSNAIPVQTTDVPPPIHQEPEPQQAWGSAAQVWGTQTEPANGGDSWGIGDHANEEWAPADSLLERPQGFTNALPTIPEQSSDHFTQNGPYSEVGESVDEEYTDDYSPQHAAQSPQSQTLTPTAAVSVMGTPLPQPTISLAQAAAAAQEQMQRQHHFVHASDAARKHEEERNQRNQNPTAAPTAANPPNPPIITPSTRPASLPPPPPAVPVKISTASAWAASHEKKHAPPAPAQPAQQSTSGGRTWEYPQPFFPNSTRAIPAIPVDPSWIMTGGNTWSNKHRTTKGQAVPRPQIDEDAWNQQLNQFRHAQQVQQALLEKQLHKGQPQPHFQQQQQPQHHKHHSHPGHPMQHQRPSKQAQTWQTWGKDDYEDEEEEYSEDTATPEGWAGEEDEDPAAAAWGQGWGKQPAQHQSKRERGRAHERKPEDQWAEWGQTAATGGGGGWEQNGWGQHAGSAMGHDGEWAQQSQNSGQQKHRQPQKHQQQQQQQHQHHHQHHQKSKSASHAGHENGRGHDMEAWGMHGEGLGKEAAVWGTNAEVRGGAGGADDWAAGEWPSSSQQHQGKVQFHGKEGDGTRNVVTAQQRSQILNNFLVQAQHGQAQHGQKHQSLPATQKSQKESKTQHDKWAGGAWEAEDHGWGSIEDEDGEYEGNRRVHFSPKTSDIWGGSPRSVPSKTLVHAQQGVVTTPLNDASNVRFVESRGAAFAFVSNAFFGNSRFARERIYWMFPTNKDQRVANMLAWTQKMSFNLATFGLMKFLQTRERGALFINTIFRMQQHPQDPAIDWLTFNQLQGTMDKTLQESVAFYDPARLVIVFVYLPSQSGNSVAIWRRKVNVPDNARLKYQAEVNAITQNLRKDKEYVVLVDEIPPKPKVPQKGQLRKSVPTKSSAKKEKGKWWKFFLS